jgi:uncharacterized membrane protein
MAYDRALGEPARAGTPAVRRIGIGDLRAALAAGLADFQGNPTHVIFLCLLYPLVGLMLARLVYGYSVLPLLFPLAGGFALLGPLFALGLYEISRRREQAIETTWRDAFKVLAAPNLGGIMLLGFVLLGIFMLWLEAAQVIYQVTLAPLMSAAGPISPGLFFRAVLATPEGWVMILLGNLVGFLFAVIVLTLTVVSFPLLLDRDIPGGAAAQASVAVQASVAAVVANPGTMALWGLIVAFGLLLGSLPLFIGLAVVLPVLGHATWHLYRAVIAR